MTRAVGILVGALLMLAIFLLALSAGISPALVQAPLPVVIRSAAHIPDEPVLAQDATIEHGVLPVPAADSPDEEDRPNAGADGIEITPQSWNQSMASYETVHRNAAAEVSRYLVWSPFRSEWAAQGFARRLTLATEVPVEVINEGPGNYQVVFSYRDDGERQALVTQIENVTGLELE